MAYSHLGAKINYLSSKGYTLRPNMVADESVVHKWTAMTTVDILVKFAELCGPR